MSEKKRVRPTKAKVEELEEVIHRQCIELNEWREKYRELIESIKEGKEVKVLRNHICALESENETMKRSNDYMAKEIDRIRLEHKELRKKYEEVIEELDFLKSRGFWARLWNITY